MCNLDDFLLNLSIVLSLIKLNIFLPTFNQLMQNVHCIFTDEFSTYE